MAAMPTETVLDVFIDGLNSWLQLPEKSLNLIRSIVVKLYTAALMYVSHPSPSVNVARI